MDDDETFRDALAGTLRDDGYEVFDFDDPVALPPLESLAGRVAALVTDYRMRSSDGLSLATRFHTLNPEAPVVIITSYSTASLEAEVAGRPYLHLLRKPVEYTRLVALLKR